SGGGLVDVLEAAARGGVTLDVRGSPYGPSDHTRFYEAGVPAVLFTTGGHHDYHRPTDTADRIDAPGMARVAAVALRTLERLVGGPPRASGRAAPAPRPNVPDGVAGGAVLGAVVDPRRARDGLTLAA